MKNINELTVTYPNAGLYHTHFHFIDADGRVIRSSLPMNSFYSFTDLLKAFLTRSADSMGTGYVMRSKDYDAVGGIPVKYPNLLFADFELWLRLAEKGGMAVHAETCFAFRVHQSTTGSSADDKLHRGLDLYVDYLLQLKNSGSEVAAVINKHAAALLVFYCKG